MSLVVSSIVGVVYEQNSIVKNVLVDDWIAELAIIASNVCLADSSCHLHSKWYINQR